jgi:hypothetical protein
MRTLATRCVLPAGHGVDHPTEREWWHHGPGLREFPDQRLDWMPGDRRETMTDRDDEFAWDVRALTA